MKSRPRNFSRVFALAGDSTMTRGLGHFYRADGRSHIGRRKRKPEACTAAQHEPHSRKGPRHGGIRPHRLRNHFVSQRISPASAPGRRSGRPARAPRGPPPRARRGRQHGGGRQVESAARAPRRTASPRARESRRRGAPRTRARRDGAIQRRKRPPRARPRGRAPPARPRRRGRGSRRRAGARACRPRSREKTEPGTAKTSRPKSLASRAVMSDPTAGTPRRRRPRRRARR